MGTPQSPQNPHEPVLYHEIIHALQPRSPGKYVDATVGAGGHAWGILNESSPEGLLLGFDRDPHAIEIAKRRLTKFLPRTILVHASYVTLLEQIHKQGWQSVDGILFDLGVSSMQLTSPERGFTFQALGPLDMRFDPNLPVTAANLVNELSETDLIEILWRYGEERSARKIARTIIASRPISTTLELAEMITQVKGKRERIHPATKTFQALRMAVNEELQAIDAALPQAIEALRPGGIVAVISFHSLEDRIVKQFFRRESADCICPPELPVCTCNHSPVIRELTRHPITPGEQELQQNPRARSAKLRIAQKI